MGKRVLGIAFGPGTINVAEVDQGPAIKLLRAAAFTFSEGDTLEKPLELGKKFAAFLKENKFSAKTAIAGLPTQWLMLKMKNVPAMSAVNLAGMLRLQAERDFSSDANDLIIDFVGGAAADPASGARPLLLAAALRGRVEQIRAVLKFAGLQATTLTSAALALTNAINAGTVLSVAAFGAELIAKGPGGVYLPGVLASSITADGSWIGNSASEALRTLAMYANDPGEKIVLWNGAGLSNAQIQQISTVLKVDIRPLSALTGVDAASVPDASKFGHAIALARLIKSANGDTLDFFDSKLVEKPQGMFAKFKTWMALAALLAVICVGWLAVSWYRDSAEFAALNQQSEARKAETKSAKEFVSRFASTQGWYDKRPNVLDCLKELADVIPSDGGAWMTKLSVKEDFRCEMSAKAVNDKRYFEVLDRIERNEAFRDVKLVYMNKQDKKNTDVSFAISFIYWKQ